MYCLQCKSKRGTSLAMQGGLNAGCSGSGPVCPIDERLGNTRRHTSGPYSRFPNWSNGTSDLDWIESGTVLRGPGKVAVTVQRDAMKRMNACPTPSASRVTESSRGRR